MAKVTNYNFNYDMSQVVLWQYGDAERLKAIIANEQAFIDENTTGFYTDFNKDVLNIATANTFGLSVWGRLLNVMRPAGFTDAQYRMLLRARIYLLTFDGSAKALNEFFHILFPEAIVDIKDNLDMTATITFISGLDPEYSVLFRSPYVETFLPRPTGVEYITNLAPTDYTTVFGFEGMTDPDGNQLPGFDQGTFIAG